ncbi:MAG: helix-turn-helix transcriptional regulator [Chlorobiaceae bacterium]|nr:helix-turn-helix transcriptional regulator [Chlorobiaceae bacterium]
MRITDNPTLKEVLIAIGEKIRAERQRLGYTQEQLAERAGFHRTYVGMVERGEQNITLESYNRFAEALGMGMYELMHSTLAAHHAPSDVGPVAEKNMNR